MPLQAHIRDYVDKYTYPFENYFLDTSNNGEWIIIDKETYKVIHNENDIVNHPAWWQAEYIRIKFNPDFTFEIPQHVKYIELFISMNELYEHQDRKIFTSSASSNLIGMKINLDYDLDNRYEIFNNTVYKEMGQMMNILFPLIIDYIPQNIEYLEVDFWISDIHKYENLKTFIYRGNGGIINLNNLPNGLQRLQIDQNNLDCPIDNLPPTLKYLSIDVGSIGDYCDGYKYSFDNLPTGLEVLFLPQTTSMDGDEHDYDGNLNNLPASLKYLCLPAWLSSKTDYNNLPDNLEVLEVWNYNNIISKMNTYPKNLKKLFTNIEPSDTTIEMIRSKRKNYGFDIYYKKWGATNFRLLDFDH